MSLLFYDVEVFKYDDLVVFSDIDNREVAHFWNNRERMDHGKWNDYPSGFEGVAPLIKNNVIVGYNNYHYDDYILTMMMNNTINSPTLIKALNDRIISGNTPTIKVSPLIESLDTMQQIDVSVPSLKQIEGNMGKSIIESSVDFNIDRPLTDEEREEVLKYCRYDVQNTIEVYKKRVKSYFEIKESLLSMLPKDKAEIAGRWNTTTLSAQILLGDEISRKWKSLHIPDKYWRNVEDLPDSVFDMWENATSDDNELEKGVSKKVHLYGCDIVFGLGGLHGAPKKAGRYTNVKLADVGSMYPSLICMLNALGDATEKYDEIRQERLKIKHVDKVKSNALKLILNSVYGNFKNRYSSLFNPKASATVCIYGQIALFSLCRELYKAGYKIININTDGVAFVDDPDLHEAYKEICDAWEEEFKGMVLEVDEFDTWIQKDVNNYLATQGDHIKTKGGETNKYAEDKFFANNNCRITQIALVEKLINGTPVLTTFVNNVDKPLLWQYVLKAGRTYKGVQDRNGEWQNKVNRVFAVNENCEEVTKLYKVRQDDALVNFPDAPERMYIWNDDVDKIENFAEIIDYDHYKRIVDSKLEGWATNVY